MTGAMTSFPGSATSASAQRTLAAIVFTDAVNFSARMNVDEESTLKLFREDSILMQNLCEKYEGEVLKFTGDGMLMYFQSAVQAVGCAIEVQKQFAARTTANPADPGLSHRIGIHLGDVFVTEGDVMGDGVNIAARLQSEAEPGGICISQTVYDVVKNKIALRATFLGPRELKNIGEAVPVYKILLGAQESAETVASAKLPRRSKKAAPIWLWPAVGAASVIVLVAVLSLLPKDPPPPAPSPAPAPIQANHATPAPQPETPSTPPAAVSATPVTAAQSAPAPDETPAPAANPPPATVLVPPPAPALVAAGTETPAHAPEPEPEVAALPPAPASTFTPTPAPEPAPSAAAATVVTTATPDATRRPTPAPVEDPEPPAPEDPFAPRPALPGDEMFSNTVIPRPGLNPLSFRRRGDVSTANSLRQREFTRTDRNYRQQLLATEDLRLLASWVKSAIKQHTREQPFGSNIFLDGETLPMRIWSGSRDIWYIQTRYGIEEFFYEEIAPAHLGVIVRDLIRARRADGVDLAGRVIQGAREFASTFGFVGGLD